MFFSKNGHKRVHPFTKKYIFANDLHIIDSKIGPSKESNFNKTAIKRNK